MLAIPFDFEGVSTSVLKFGIRNEFSGRHFRRRESEWRECNYNVLVEFMTRTVGLENETSVCSETHSYALIIWVEQKTLNYVLQEIISAAILTAHFSIFMRTTILLWVFPYFPDMFASRLSARNPFVASTPLATQKAACPSPSCGKKCSKPCTGTARSSEPATCCSEDVAKWRGSSPATYRTYV